VALLFMDTFDHYQTSDITKKWTECSTPGSTTTLLNTNAAALAFPGGGQNYSQIAGGNNIFLGKTLPTNYTVGIVGGWFYFTSLPNNVNHIMMLCDTLVGLGGTCQVNVAGDGAGHLTVQRGGGSGSAGTVLATSTLTLSLNTWYHIELKTTIHPSAGVVQLKVNGVDWIASTSSLNTRNSGTTQFNALELNAGSANITYCKLIYVCDTSGSVANDFLGVCRGVVLRPVGAGNYSQWTPNSGANWFAAADAFADGDLSFNADSTAGHIDTYAFDDAPAGSGTIHGIQHVIEARQDAGATRTIAPVQRSSSTDYVGTSQNLASGYVFLTEAKSINPATSAGYTVSDLNAAEFGVKLIA
jgi:hypothetical protein